MKEREKSSILIRPHLFRLLLGYKALERVHFCIQLYGIAARLFEGILLKFNFYISGICGRKVQNMLKEKKEKGKGAIVIDET